MTFLQILGGTIEVELISADPSGFLTQVSNAGITVYDAREISILCWRFRVNRGEFRSLKEIANSKGCSLKIIGREGIYWRVKSILQRPVLLAGLIFLAVFVMIIPTRVLFVTVEGNRTIPSRLILEIAAENGIQFGVSRVDVRSERVKNALLAEIPQLQWAGVNTRGCTAVITIQERSTPERTEGIAAVSRIVAGCDGVITSLTATSGNGLCVVGQAVKAGQTLISGYTDCGISILATRARGEIYADTQHDLSVIMPARYTVRGEVNYTKRNFSLIIGKNRINFQKDSGISDVSCAKIYKEYCLTLPGGFQLPVKLAVEIVTGYEINEDYLREDTAQQLLSDHATAYLREQMVAGRIISADQDIVLAGEHYVLSGSYACNEMIGRERSEEILNGKTD